MLPKFMMHAFSLALVGGLLIGLSASLLLASHGKIAGISGIAGGLFSKPSSEDTLWRVSFLLGLVIVGAGLAMARPEMFRVDVKLTTPSLVVAGLLVGFGTRLGNGCTSGHGVYGIGRFSPRSVMATIVFLGAGVVTTLVLGAR